MNYENISDLKAAIISIRGSVGWNGDLYHGNDWKWSFGIWEEILKNRKVMCLCVVYIKILMLLVHFELNLMKIEPIELELFKF